MNNTKKNLVNEDPINQTAAIANLLSGVCALPIVSKTANFCNSYAPVIAFRNAIQFLYDFEEYSFAYELVLAWFNLTGRTVPDTLAGINPSSAFAEAFIDEFLLDLKDILEEELYEDEFDEEIEDDEECDAQECN